MPIRLMKSMILLVCLLISTVELAAMRVDMGVSPNLASFEVGIQAERFHLFHAWTNGKDKETPSAGLSGLDFHVLRTETTSLSFGALYEGGALRPRVGLSVRPMSFMLFSLGRSALGTDYGVRFSSPPLGGSVTPFVGYQQWPNRDGSVMVGFQVGGFSNPQSERADGPRYLIVNADDLGLSDGVTEGIIRAWRDGVVSSTSALVNVDGAMERIAAAHQAHPDMPIGLHLNITLGRPILPAEEVPTLIGPTGEFYSPDEITSKLLSISLVELRAELRAQADLLLQHGIPISHLDYHNHMVVLYTPFYQVVRELAKELGVPVRQPVPESVHGRVKLSGGGGTGAVIWKMMWFGIRHPIMALKLLPRMTPAAYKAQAKLLIEDGTAAPDAFIDVYFGRATVENFIDMLRQLPPGVSEVAVHPAIVDDQLRELDAEYGEARANELAVLLDPTVREALALFDVQLVDFAFLQQQQGNL